MTRIVVGMSGGVDSAVSALLLKQEGYDVIGVFMNNWDDDADDGACTSEGDWADVRRICEQIDIPYYAVNFSKEYMERVFQIFLREYSLGRTPNPDVLCNREIKFKAFLDFALQLEADKIATGHFARTDESGNLLKGLDPNKEQSYFLYMLRQQQLSRTLFPVGERTKQDVRSIARQHGLSVHDKKDSTGICFIGERRFRTFLSRYLPAQPGLMRDVSGIVIGEHQGLMYYTLGQRRGLGIGGRGDGRSYFVVDKDMTNNELIVAQGEDHPRLYSRFASISNLTWVGDSPCEEGREIALRAKLRYRQPDQEVMLIWQGDKAKLRFLEPQRAVTPGQSAVLYDGDYCLGGGIIEGSSA